MKCKFAVILALVLCLCICLGCTSGSNDSEGTTEKRSSAMPIERIIVFDTLTYEPVFVFTGNLSWNLYDTGELYVHIKNIENNQDTYRIKLANNLSYIYLELQSDTIVENYFEYNPNIKIDFGMYGHALEGFNG